MASDENRTNAPTLYKNTSNIERARLVQKAHKQYGFCEVPARRGVSVVILNKDNPEYIVPLLKNLVRQKAWCAQAGVEIQVLVGDTGSTDPGVLAVYDEVKDACSVLRGLEPHVSKSNNLVAFSKAHCENILFLSNEIVFQDEETPLLSMFEYIDTHPSTGALGACLWLPDGAIRHTGIDFHGKGEVRGVPFHMISRETRLHNALNSPGIVPAVTGACLLIPSRLFERIGGMNERYDVEYQDIDLCLFVRRLGFLCECVNFGHIVHNENGTSPRGEGNRTDRGLFLRRWGTFIGVHFL